MSNNNFGSDKVATLLAWGMPEAQIADVDAQPQDRIVFGNCRSVARKEKLTAHLNQVRAQWQNKLLIYIPADKREALEAVLGEAIGPDPDPYITPEELSMRLIGYASVQLEKTRSETDDPSTIQDIAASLAVTPEKITDVLLHGDCFEMVDFEQYAISLGIVDRNELLLELMKNRNVEPILAACHALCDNQTPTYQSYGNVRRTLDIGTLVAEKEESLEPLLMRALNNCCNEASACSAKGDKFGVQETKNAFDALLEMTSAVNIESHALEQLVRKINAPSQWRGQQ